MSSTGQRTDLSASDYLKAAQRYPWLVALPILVLGFLAWFLLGRGAAQYQADADVLVRASEAQDEFNNGGRPNPSFLPNEVRFAKSDVVRDAVAQRLGIEPFAELDDINVEITASETSEILTFSAIDDSAEAAATKANAYAELYVEQRRQSAVDSYGDAIELLEDQLVKLRDDRVSARRGLDAANIDLTRIDEETAAFQRKLTEIARLEIELSPQLDAFNAEETALIEQRSSLKLSQLLARTGIASVTNSAFAPEDSLPNAGVKGFIIAELIGLVLGLMLAVAVSNLDDKLRDLSDVEAAFPDMTILGSLPYQSSVRKRRSITVLSDPNSAYSEAIYQIRTSLRFMMLEKGVRLVVVTSSQPSEGKTTFSTNFAWSLAGMDERVVLIDGDLRRPLGHDHFGVDLAPGLTDLVLFNRKLESIECRFDEQDPGFSFVPAGMFSGNPADFMGSSELVKQVKAISTEALTVVDAAPVLPVSDARALAGASDLTILMVRLEESHSKDVAAAIANLKNAGATNVALVTVGGRAKAPGYYGSGGTKGVGDSDGTPTVVSLARASRPAIKEGDRGDKTLDNSQVGSSKPPYNSLPKKVPPVAKRLPDSSTRSTRTPSPAKAKTKSVQGSKPQPKSGVSPKGSGATSAKTASASTKSEATPKKARSTDATVPVRAKPDRVIEKPTRGPRSEPRPGSKPGQGPVESKTLTRTPPGTAEKSSGKGSPTGKKAVGGPKQSNRNNPRKSQNSPRSNQKPRPSTKPTLDKRDR